jgi:hypothetical protein
MSSNESEASESDADSESETSWSETSAIESDADKIRRNAKSQTDVEIYEWERNGLEILDALINNTVVWHVSIYENSETGRQLKLNQALVKLSELMKCNKSVQTLTIFLGSGLLDEEIHFFERNQLFATMAASGGWSSIQEFSLDVDNVGGFEPLSLMEAGHLSSFIIQCANLRTLSLEVSGDEVVPILETLSRTKVQSLKLVFGDTSYLQNGTRRLATALERCTCITELRLEVPSHEDLEILLIESIPKMLGLRKLMLEMDLPYDQQFFDMVGQCIGGHQGEIEELRLKCYSPLVNSTSIVGLAPALRRLKVIQFELSSLLSAPQIGELSGMVADCDTLEEFGYNLGDSLADISCDDFKPMFELCSRFPCLKRVTQNHYGVELHGESTFVAFLEMVKTSKTIEQAPFMCNDEQEASLNHHCRNNMMHNQIKLIREKSFLAVKVPSNAWPLILKEFSDMPDVLYYLLQQHGAMIGPTCHGCKRKQDFD